LLRKQKRLSTNQLCFYVVKNLLKQRSYQQMKQTGLSFFSEILWALLIGVFAAVFLLPLYDVLDASFLRINLLLILLFAILFRYTIFLNQTPYLKPMWIRFILVITVLIIFFQIFKQTQDFFELFDTHDINFFLRKDRLVNLSPDVIQEKFAYFRKEFLFFATGSLIVIIAFSLRTVASFWTLLKGKNR